MRQFAYDGGGAKPAAELLPGDQARAIYDGIVAKMRDTALLEFMDCNLIRSSVFPVEAKGEQKIRLVYEQLLEEEEGRIDFMIPRSESLDFNIPWSVTASIESKRPVSAIYSPSHPIESKITKQKKGSLVEAKTAKGQGSQPGPFRLSWVLGGEGVSASVFVYPDPETGGGYFLLLAGLPGDIPGKKSNENKILREVTLVFDRSRSMGHGEIDQACEVALQILAGLEPGEAFNMIIYNDKISAFASEPVIKSDDTMRRAEKFLKTFQAQGGTNIYSALHEALNGETTSEMLPIILFLTDGLPTSGNTSETAIRDLALKSNPNNRRIFSFGVGADVSVPLLEKIAYATRATPSFVLPDEDIEVKAGRVFAQLAGPVLTEPRIVTLNAKDKPAPARTCDMLPAPPQ